MKTIDQYLMAAHKNTKLKNVTTGLLEIDMNPVNKLFFEYQKTIADKDSSDECIEISYNRYKKERNKLSYEIMKKDIDCWNGSLENDNKTFWKYVDWKGNFKGKKQYDAPTMPEFQHFFEDLYDNDDKNEVEEIKKLESEVYVPVLDDPISSEETIDAYEDMKKSGYDYNLPVLRILLTNFTLLIVSILNLMFYVRYPLSLVTSLLSLIPKKGNLKLPKNFRGIQMLKTFANLYDRIITNRLKLWLPFHDNQTAFQKLKSTLLHIFTLRVLIFIVKRKKKKLFIGSMDIEKAFDIVPRLLLLKKLIRLGIGSCMLAALKALYSSTSCILKFGGEVSRKFPMLRGIRQGAASSVLLFNEFMDDLFGYLETKCDVEEIIGDIHSLIHADDTIILSTDRESFVKKCIETTRFIRSNKLKLNVMKSAFTVINSNDPLDRVPIEIEGGFMNYSSKIDYLGIVISDCGSLKQDIKFFLDKKRPNVSIKFLNFCMVNRNAPLCVKLDVLDKCVTSSLLYSAETWGPNVQDVEFIYRTGVKTALDIRENINNEITYIESNTFPLECKIKSLQLKFWLYLEDYMQLHPRSAIAKVTQLGRDMNIPYIRHYINLAKKYGNPNDCKVQLQNDFRVKWTNKINNATVEDNESRLGVYSRINPQLQCWIPVPQAIHEIERKIVTRYRTGSHSLNIELGRFSNIPRENRLCKCGSGIQTIWHIFSECPLTEGRLATQFVNLNDIFQRKNVHHYLLTLTKILKIPIGRL